MQPSFRGRLRNGWCSMPKGSRVSGRLRRSERVRFPVRMKGQYERDERRSAYSPPGGQDTVTEEDRNFDGEAELQPWPQQGGGGGEEARACANGCGRQADYNNAGAPCGAFRRVSGSRDVRTGSRRTSS